MSDEKRCARVRRHDEVRALVAAFYAVDESDVVVQAATDELALVLVGGWPRNVEVMNGEVRELNWTSFSSR